MKIVQFVIDNKEIILPCVALVWSEVLSLNPSWQANGLVQLLTNVLKKGSKK